MELGISLSSEHLRIEEKTTYIEYSKKYIEYIFPILEDTS